MSKKMIKVTALSGHSLKVDISEQACGKFKIPNKDGVKAPAKHGMKITHPVGGEGTVQGVAPEMITHGKMTLWTSLKSDGGKVGFSSYFLYVRV